MKNYMGISQKCPEVPKEFQVFPICDLQRRKRKMSSKKVLHNKGAQFGPGILAESQNTLICHEPKQISLRGCRCSLLTSTLPCQVVPCLVLGLVTVKFANRGELC